MRRPAQSILAPKDRRAIYDWAHDAYKFTHPLAKTDPLDIQKCRHFQAPFESLADDRKREISVRAGVRSGKTLIGEVFIGRTIVCDPGEIMWVTGKHALADQEWETRMERMFLASPQVAAQLPDPTPQGSRRNKATGLVELRNGSSLYVHGNAELNLQQKGIRYAVHDEVWEWASGKLAESYGRIGDYLKMGISKVLNISQGGDDDSDWAAIYGQGNCQEWEVQCLDCHRLFEPRWTHYLPNGKLAGMRWEDCKDEHGFWVIEPTLNSIRYECPHCGFIHTDTARTKNEWNRTGQYTVTNQNARPEKDSFHWPGTIDWPWRELVDKYLQAINAYKLGNIDPLIQFFTKYMGENKSERSILEGAANFHRATYDIVSKWELEDERIMTVDVQETVFWATIRQWSRRARGQSRRLWFGKLYSFADVEAKREEFGVPKNRVGCDSGHRAKGDNGVYAACCRYGWIALKGEQERVYALRMPNGQTVQKSYSSPTAKDPEIGTQRQGTRFATLIHFSSETMADRLDGLIANGLWIEPDVVDQKLEDEYKRQMSDEVKKRFEDQKTHRVYYKRVCRTKDNHAYDCGKMQVFFATALDILPDL